MLQAVRTAVAVCIIASCWTPGLQAAVDERVSAFFATYCVACHGEAKQEGDFRIDQLRISQSDADAEHWQQVLDKLHLGEMPPEDAKRPSLAEVEPISTWIEAELTRARDAFGRERGEVVLRRLNRLEYENTIADLFDVRGDFAVAFPEDATAAGFNTNGSALSLSAEQLTEYMKAADFVLSRAIVTKPRPESKAAVFTLSDMTDRIRRQFAERERYEAENKAKATPSEIKRREEAKAQGNYGPPYYPRYGDDSLIAVRYTRPSTREYFRVTEPGWYRFKFTAYAVRNGGRPMRLQVTHGTGTTEEPQTLAGVAQLNDETPCDFEYRVYLQPQHRVELEMLDGTNWLPGSKIADDRSPAIAVRSIEIEGPLIDEWPPRGHQVLFGSVDAANLTDEMVPQLLRDLAPKLFRRPVDEQVVEEFAAFYRDRRAEATPLEAYKLTVKGMMTSPLFLYHYETAGGSDDFVLANRLSYFLWRSLPDAELYATAAAGKLSQPDELKRQTMRLLADPKSERFLKDFVGQWLGIAKVGEMQPDQGLYPEYDADLERAMVGETEAFVRELIDRDLSLANLIDSDWAMLNDRLARHYGIGGVEGNKIRKVLLDKSKTVRGGLLTQASVLNVTSNGTTTSPVVRGVWILDRLLGTPAPPPPPDVPAIEPDIRGASTIQEQLALHRTVPQCAACHKKIDPYGMALESFDVIGRERENYRALIPKPGQSRPKLGEGKPVDASGELVKLGPYADFVEFRKLLARNEDLVYRNVAEKLAVYALGRSMTFADRDDLNRVANETRTEGRGLKTLIVALVQSSLFNRP